MSSLTIKCLPLSKFSSNVQQIAIHTAELIVPDPSPFEAETIITKLENKIRQVVIKFQQN
jgi:hypothetical protein